MAARNARLICTLMVKQEELTQLNRDNARLVTEARQHQKNQHTLEQILSQRHQEFESARSALADMKHTNDKLEQQCQALQGEVARFDEAYAGQTQQVENLQERLVEVTDLLKLFTKISPPENGLAPEKSD